jgi:hypothetical protein
LKSTVFDVSGTDHSPIADSGAKISIPVPLPTRELPEQLLSDIKHGVELASFEYDNASARRHRLVISA